MHVSGQRVERQERLAYTVNGRSAVYMDEDGKWKLNGYSFTRAGLEHVRIALNALADDDPCELPIIDGGNDDERGLDLRQAQEGQIG